MERALFTARAAMGLGLMQRTRGNKKARGPLGAACSGSNRIGDERLVSDA